MVDLLRRSPAEFWLRLWGSVGAARNSIFLQEEDSSHQQETLALREHAACEIGGHRENSSHNFLNFFDNRVDVHFHKRQNFTYYLVVHDFRIIEIVQKESPCTLR
eukprot:TRINITY_DN26838_c0_g2_i1.p2 TRINITY_DN26838_c0_g2~~TRINITY_DN26838_c0_g2_i1.p2  ORF type:complete len:105 (+),score=5.20 TRINITY_DN26838_c0_g2_i1:140-454(+)